jgi:hypothetical protein
VYRYTQDGLATKVGACCSSITALQLLDTVACPSSGLVCSVHGVPPPLIQPWLEVNVTDVPYALAYYPGGPGGHGAGLVAGVGSALRLYTFIKQKPHVLCELEVGGLGQQLVACAPHDAPPLLLCRAFLVASPSSLWLDRGCLLETRRALSWLWKPMPPPTLCFEWLPTTPAHVC